MLEIQNLHASVLDIENSEILKGVDLKVNKGEVHAIMGPNGSGKSTLANVLMGRPDYEITDGDILVDGESIAELRPDQRAHLGLFLAFQYPAEIPGVRPWQFLKAAHDAKAEARGEEKMSVRNFTKLFDEKVEAVGINPDLVKRSLNEGFSGGEKKRNEMLQLEVLQPSMAILDETDSGLDVDALRIVAEGVNSMRSPERSFIVVTHYQRLLNYITPDIVHILVDGKIVQTGGPELALVVEKDGYREYLPAAGATG
ncbi:MAG: Fe-S cluster assembly ATPase SufC [SAR202 cluster bacterium]|jgi:Fe-S cluster assembly ATP-binding protein|nr:MAG: Fe-S cluster assembly ATPase SufC [SAR202 cluster bacterium]MCH2530728.1 Fe-S cluster assembly ATPase SufC [Dehalococcoidia bacterium]KAA1301289.1 MAG: Fe-S cluster assembly ATPase SufC [SAR202 cluster bacterium]KAA1301528.1 MAG: Fe-S cluster assembly ATPase SufC [SAR202 cluster bacterium]MQG89669.1 Fe-S cluster assembly ATPase SufC [SAR202 cluster bacterium]